METYFLLFLAGAVIGLIFGRSRRPDLHFPCDYPSYNDIVPARHRPKSTPRRVVEPTPEQIAEAYVKLQEELRVKEVKFIKQRDKANADAAAEFRAWDKYLESQK